MLEDPIALAWQKAPMGEPLSDEEQDLAEEGLAAIEAGETVRGSDMRSLFAGRIHR